MKQRETPSTIVNVLDREVIGVPARTVVHFIDRTLLGAHAYTQSAITTCDLCSTVLKRTATEL